MTGINFLVIKNTPDLFRHATEVDAVTPRGMSGNSFKGMLIFQMLLDINKAPNWRAEIQFERSSPWRCRDVYPRPRVSLRQLRGLAVVGDGERRFPLRPVYTRVTEPPQLLIPH